MAIADKLTTVAENVPKVYEAGKNARSSEWWQAVTKNGERKDYQYMFTEMTSSDEFFWEGYIPMKPTKANYMFLYNEGLSKITSSQLVLTRLLSNNANSMFRQSNFVEIEVDFSLAKKATYVFYLCKKLKKLIITFSESTELSKENLQNCDALTDLTIKGTIAKNGFNVQWSTKLTHDSLMSIINALADKTADTSGTVWEVTLGDENIAKLTEAELKIAHDKGWEVG